MNEQALRAIANNPAASQRDRQAALNALNDDAGSVVYDANCEARDFLSTVRLDGIAADFLQSTGHDTFAGVRDADISQWLQKIPVASLPDDERRARFARLSALAAAGREIEFAFGEPLPRDLCELLGYEPDPHKRLAKARAAYLAAAGDGQ